MNLDLDSAIVLLPEWGDDPHQALRFGSLRALFSLHPQLFRQQRRPLWLEEHSARPQRSHCHRVWLNTLQIGWQRCLSRQSDMRERVEIHGKAPNVRQLLYVAAVVADGAQDLVGGRVPGVVPIAAPVLACTATLFKQDDTQQHLAHCDARFPHAIGCIDLHDSVLWEVAHAATVDGLTHIHLLALDTTRKIMLAGCTMNTAFVSSSTASFLALHFHDIIIKLHPPQWASWRKAAALSKHLVRHSGQLQHSPQSFCTLP